MAITSISHTIVGTTNTGGITSAIDTTGATLLVAVVSWYGGTPGTITDSKGNTWTPLTAQASGAINTQLLYCAAPIVGSGHTFSTTYPYSVLAVFAFAGTDSGAYEAQSGAASAGTVTTVQPGSITPAENGCLLITAEGDGNTPGPAPTCGSGFTTVSLAYSGSDFIGGGGAYLIQPTAAATNPTWTLGAAAPTAAAMAVFRPLAGGTPGNASGTAPTVNLSAQSGTATGAAIASGSAPVISLSAPAGTAVGDGTGGGEPGPPAGAGKPASGTPLDPTNPLHSGLAVVYGILETGGSVLADSLAGNNISLGSSVSIVPNSGNPYASFAGMEAEPAPLATPIVFPSTADWSIAFSGHCTGAPSASMLAGNPPAPNDRIWLFGGNYLEIMTAGTITDFTALKDFSADHDYVLAYDHVGLKIHCYVDGVEVGTGIAIGATHALFTLSSLGDGGIALAFNFVGRLNYFYGWQDRALLAADAAALHTAPYGIFLQPGQINLRRAIVSAIIANPACLSLVSTRVRPGRIAQKDQLALGPAVTYQVISDPRLHHLNGPAGIADARVELVAQANTIAEAGALSEALRNCFDGLTGTIAGLVILETSLDDEHDAMQYPEDGTDLGVYRIAQDIFVKYRESIPVHVP